jgi:ferredoxin
MLVELNEAITPDYFMMDGIMAMEGPGPARGVPVKTGVILGSTNPLALDIIASKIAGYNPLVIPTSRIAIHRKKWLRSVDEIIFDGPPISSLVKNDFKRVPLSRFSNISVKFIMNRIGFVRKFDRRPVFIKQNCTGCHKCISICPVKALRPDGVPYHIILTDKKCIRCYCCSEVCIDNAVEIRRKVFGI